MSCRPEAMKPQPITNVLKRSFHEYCEENDQEHKIHLDSSASTDDYTCLSSHMTSIQNDEYSFFHDDYSSDDDDDDSQMDDEEETRVAKALVKAAFSRTISAPSLVSLFLAAPTPKKQRVNQDMSLSSIAEYDALAGTVKKSTIMAHERKSSMKRQVFSAPSLQILTTVPPSPKTYKTVPSPEECLRAILSSAGKPYQTFPALELQNFFCPLTEEAIQSYDMTIVSAVREEDLDKLRELRKQPERTLQCCNRFGESIVHAACRRGSVHVLHFLLYEASVSCKLICDSGRTPLHDACWTVEPNLEVAAMLMTVCPDLLYVTDKRGCTPLAYISRDHWPAWIEFLSKRNLNDLLPRELDK